MAMQRAKSVQFSADDRSAWAKLQRARPDVDWHRASLRGADLTGDGGTTRVMVGNEDDGSGWIGLVRAGREGAGNPFLFAVARAIGLSFEKLERTQDWLFGGAFPLAGCRPKRGMQLLRVADQTSDTVTLLYWSAEDRQFAAWSTTIAAAAPAAPEPFEDLDLTG
jgi:hypothetical protein